MECQARTGVSVDITLAKETLKRIDKEMTALQESIRPHLPIVHMSKTEYNTTLPPAKPFKTLKKGITHSNNFVKWCWKNGHTAYTTLSDSSPMVHIKGAGTSWGIESQAFKEWKPSMEMEFSLYSNSHIAQLKQRLIDVYGLSLIHI